MSDAITGSLHLSSNDDDGFVYYVETTVDPGPWLNIATALFCLVSIVVFPCLVAAGRSYEKHRMRKSGIVFPDDKDENEEMDVEEEETQAESPEKSCEHGSLHSWPRYNSKRDDAKPFSSRSLDEKMAGSDKEKQKTKSRGGPSSYVRSHTFTAPLGAPRGELLTAQKLQCLIDAVIMPPYPDEAGPNVDIARSRTALEINSTGSTAGDSPLRGKPTLLDTGAARKNRRTGARRYQRGLMDQRWQKEQERERRLSLICRGEQIDKSWTCNSVTGMVSPMDVSGESYPSDERVTISSEGAVDASFQSSRNSSPTRNSLNRIWSSVESTSEEAVSMVDISPADAVDANDPGFVPAIETVPMEGEKFDLCCGAHAWWKTSTISSSFGKLLDIAEWDQEAKRILNLSIPFSFAALAEGLFEVVRVALIANFIGTDAVAAYTIVLLLLGLVDEFFGGFALTSASLCSHAFGRGNHKLAGEYVQISCILYTLCYIPNALIWMFVTDEVVRLFGFNETTAQMAQVYARYTIIGDWFEGIDEAYGSLLAVIEHERFITCLGIISEVFATCAILIALLTQGSTTLADVGIIELVTDILFFGLSLVISNWKGWMTEFNGGLYRTNALCNKVAVKTVLRTAVPLAFGGLLQYGEWEILTVFVAALGPAEVTAWGIVGTIWETLEALTEGFGDAGEIRVSYHLGASHPARARLSSYKTILVSVISATIVTSIMWMLGEDLARWMTPDPTLQHLIVEVLPLMGIGNITLTGGTVSWALVGAQGRYRLSTFVAFVGSWCITLPLAAIFTYGLNIDLQGVTSAVVIGYSFTGTSLLYILVRSDWARLSKRIVDLQDQHGSDSSSSSSESSQEEEEDHELVSS